LHSTAFVVAIFILKCNSIRIRHFTHRRSILIHAKSRAGVFCLEKRSALGSQRRVHAVADQEQEQERSLLLAAAAGAAT
jgi:hypothetical protein